MHLANIFISEKAVMFQVFNKYGETLRVARFKRPNEHCAWDWMDNLFGAVKIVIPGLKISDQEMDEWMQEFHRDQKAVEG